MFKHYNNLKMTVLNEYKSRCAHFKYRLRIWITVTFFVPSGTTDIKFPVASSNTYNAGLNQPNFFSLEFVSPEWFPG